MYQLIFDDCKLCFLIPIQLYFLSTNDFYKISARKFMKKRK